MPHWDPHYYSFGFVVVVQEGRIRIAYRPTPGIETRTSPEEHLSKFSADLSPYFETRREGTLSTKPALTVVRQFAPEVGKAYTGPDGVARWVTSVSRRGYYSCLWQDNELRWQSGGKYLFCDFPIGPEYYDPPQVGETYILVGPTGVPSETSIP